MSRRPKLGKREIRERAQKRAGVEERAQGWKRERVAKKHMSKRFWP